MPIELSILTFIILIVLPFVFLIISIRPTQEGYEYVKISMMVLTSILFFIAAYAFVSTGGISIAIMDESPAKKDLITPGTIKPIEEARYNDDEGPSNPSKPLCTFSNYYSGSTVNGTFVLGCTDPQYAVNFQGWAEANKKIVLFAVDGQYTKEVSIKVPSSTSVPIYVSFGIPYYHQPNLVEHSYYYKESNPIVGSSFDMQVLASVYMMIGLISTVFAVGEVFRIPVRRI